MKSPYREPLFLSIVFSFLNEQDVLPQLLSRIKNVLIEEKRQGIIKDFEVIFVNDASTDQSLQVLLNFAKEDKSIKVMSTSRTFGVYQCMLTGFSFAKGDAVIYMDADLQDPPEMVPLLLKTYYDTLDVDIVHTIRRTRLGEAGFKLLITKVGHFILNRLTKNSIPQGAGDFKLLSRRAVDHVLSMNEDRPFLRGMVSWIGFNQIAIPYDRAPRQGGKSKMTVLSSRVRNIFLNHALINYSDLPLKIPLFLALVCCSISLAIFLFSVSISNWSIGAVVCMVLLLLFGLQFFSLWIIGLYLAAVHQKSKNQPLAILASTYNISQKS